MKASPRDSRPEDLDPLGAPTAEESEAAESLVETIATGDDPMARLLHAALAPSELDDGVHEAILAKVFGPSAPSRRPEEVARNQEPSQDEPTDEEIARSVRLAERLDAIIRGDAIEREPFSEVQRLGALAQAIKLAHSPTPIDEISNERLLQKAVRRPTKRAMRFVFAATAIVATLAASIMGIYLMNSAPPGRMVSEADFARVRSTTDLFDPGSPFPREGGTSERIDRIAESRAADLRQNRFLAWGVE